MGPFFESLANEKKKKRSHIKASKSFNINHITSQRPPMPSYYFSSRHSHNASSSSSSSWNEFIFSPKKKKPKHSKHKSMNIIKSNSMNNESKQKQSTLILQSHIIANIHPLNHLQMK